MSKCIYSKYKQAASRFDRGDLTWIIFNMNIWSTREKSLNWLENELSPERNTLHKGFEHINHFVELFQAISEHQGENQLGKFSRICAITLAKFNHLLLGCYSLSLDGLAQEAGALLRLVIETYELLVYFRQDISRIDEVLEDELPSPGIIGKKISGDYQNLREYLNANASHFSYTVTSVKHLFDENISIRAIPDHSMRVLRVNLELINAFQVYMLFEAINCLFTVGFDANSLADSIEKWRDEIKIIFK